MNTGFIEEIYEIFIALTINSLENLNPFQEFHDSPYSNWIVDIISSRVVIKIVYLCHHLISFAPETVGIKKHGC